MHAAKAVILDLRSSTSSSVYHLSLLKGGGGERCRAPEPPS